MPVHISKLRQLLGESKSERYIETVTGAGYRFVAPVKEAEVNDWIGFWPSPEIVAPSSESHRLYLRGEHFLKKRTTNDIWKAIECFRKSYSDDPLNILAYVSTVESYLLLYQTSALPHPNAVNRIRPLLEIISGIGKSVDLVHSMLAAVKMHLDWKLDQASKHLILALDLNANCLTAHYRYSDLLILLGKFHESLAHIQKTLRIDPMSPLTYKRLGRLFWKMDRYETALLYLDEAIELEPEDWEAHLIFGAVLAEQHRFSDSIAALNRSLDIYDNIETIAVRGYVYARAGNRDKALRVIDEIREISGELNQPTAVAKIYLALGNVELTYKFLSDAYDIHEPDLIGLKVDPMWKPLRAQSEFRALAKKVGLS